MVYVLLGTGFEEVEAITPVDLLRRAGIEVKTVGITGKTVYGSHNIGIEADILPEEIDFDALDMIVLPGGLGGVASARASQAALDALKWAWDNGRFVAAICAGPTVLADLGITDGRNATCYPGCETQMPGTEYTPVQAQQDGKLITGQAPGASFAFGLKLLAALRGEQTAADVAEGMVIRG